AGAGDLCADGGRCGRPAKAAGIRAAAAMGAGGVLGGGRRRAAGDRGIAVAGGYDGAEGLALILRSAHRVRLEGWPRASAFMVRDGAEEAPPHHEGQGFAGWMNAQGLTSEAVG